MSKNNRCSVVRTVPRKRYNVCSTVRTVYSYGQLVRFDTTYKKGILGYFQKYEGYKRCLIIDAEGFQYRPLLDDVRPCN